jgi:predicted helicase
MPTVTLNRKSAAVLAYYESLAAFNNLGATHELAVKTAFATLLGTAAKPFGWKLVPEHSMRAKGGKRIQPDGTLMDVFRLHHGHWEAKDSSDDLNKEIRKKIDLGYPTENLLFWEPRRAVLYQYGNKVADEPLDEPTALLSILAKFLDFAPEAIAQWEAAVAHFKDIIPTLGKALARILKKARKENPKYSAAFDEFVVLCRGSLNPNLAEAAVEEMLVQHLLTERILRKIFDIENFRERNVIAADIEKVIAALSAKHFRRDDFLKALDPFYLAIETAAETFTDFSEKQKFLNIVYERFFQGFAVKQADVLGVVYTPQPLVQFMIASVEQVLREHFDTTLGAKGVHIFDPFTGTGNFIVNIMQPEHIPGSALKHKYAHELHCNEVSLLPYYVASMNIEHAYFERMKQYESFEGICLVDTFETIEKEQGEFDIFNEANSERVKRQRAVKDLRVIIANPPYNAGQIDENDNNKNRKYPEIDGRVKRTYAADGTATLQRKLWDPYVKAIKFASDRIGDTGVVCYVNNNSFLTENSFDGMRKHLAQDFDLIYVLDLGGNVRKHPTLSGTTHNVFGIQVGVSINVFIRLAGKAKGKRHAAIYHHEVPIPWRKEEKYRYLDEAKSAAGVKWEKLKPNARHDWLTNDNDQEFSGFVPVGSKDAKSHGGSAGGTVFRTYSLGVSTNRDSTVHDFDAAKLAIRCEQFAEDYNAELERWKRKAKPPKDPKALALYVDNFVSYERVKWSETLKKRLVEQEPMEFDAEYIRTAAYRPYSKLFLCYAPMFVDRMGTCAEFLPTAKQEKTNPMICVNLSVERPFTALMANALPNLVFAGGFGSATYCFALYTYSADGKERRDNIPRSTLDRFIVHYDDDTITREHIFHYVYAVLHHPDYRERYTENLKRELPRIPLTGSAEDFHAFAKAGRKLADLHVGYESVKPYKLARIESHEVPPNWRVEAMKLTKEGDAVIYNDWLTLHGIPAEVHAYRLGNRSALAWVIDQYRVDRDADGEIVSDPNLPGDEKAIVRLIGQVITVSIETMKLTRALPGLKLP